MGEARRRGTQDQRQASAAAALRAKFPASIKCNECTTDLTAIVPMDTRGMEGLNLVGAAHCPNCQKATWILDGSPDAIAKFNEFMEMDQGGPAKMGVAQKPSN
jgi:hypothetical protein